MTTEQPSKIDSTPNAMLPSSSSPQQFNLELDRPRNVTPHLETLIQPARTGEHVVDNLNVSIPSPQISAELHVTLKEPLQKQQLSECLMCHKVIDPSSISFEQRLIDDKDFCRKCWDEIMFEVQEEDVPLPFLAIVAD